MPTKLFPPVTEDALKILEYKVLGKLPDPFLKEDGSRVKDEAEWREHRKTLYRHAVELQYGIMPPAPEFVEYEMLYATVKRNKGVAFVNTGTRENPLSFKIHFMFPKDLAPGEKFPVIIDGDGCWEHYWNREYLDAILEARVGYVVFDRTEIAHDVRKEGRGHGAIYKTYPRPEYTFGAVGAWAWCYSRVVDALAKSDLPYDPEWIVFMGHSRGGKTAALAGALDERAKIVTPNCTCAGGCGCYRVHMKGQYPHSVPQCSETLKDLYDKFGFWMGEGMEQYRDCEEKIPFDTHFLKALIAPRIYYEVNAAGDLWGNPIGAWQTDMAAMEVWKFLGAEENFFWSWRYDYHENLPHDAAMICNLIRHKKYGEPLQTEQFFRTPFPKPELIFDWRAPKG